jgi:phage protein U
MADTESFTMMALGDYRFALDTAAYEKLQRTTSYRWETINRLGRAPAQQFIGAGDDDISMDGVIYPHFRGGLGQLDEIRTLAGQGEPLLLVDGTGKVWGDYVVREVGEGQSVFFSNGAPRKIEFSLTLRAFGDDE